MAKIIFSAKLLYATLRPGEAQSHWIEPVAPEAVRWFTAVPINVFADIDVKQDQRVMITEVYHLRKGNNHQPDGTVGNVQVNVTIQNMDPDNSAYFHLYMAEILPD